MAEQALWRWRHCPGGRDRGLHGYFHWGLRAHQNVRRQQQGPRVRRVPLGRIQRIAWSCVRGRCRGFCTRTAAITSGAGTMIRTRRVPYAGNTTWRPTRLQFRTPNGTGPLRTLTPGSRAECRRDGGPARRSLTCSMTPPRWTAGASIGTTSNGSIRETGRMHTCPLTTSGERVTRPGGTPLSRQRR